MTKTQKQQIIENLTQEFKQAQALLVCDYKGISVKSLEELRHNARVVGVRVQVIKNTLARIALKNSDMPDLDINAYTELLWNSLNNDNKVSLFVRYIDIESGKYETKIVNKNK